MKKLFEKIAEHTALGLFKVSTLMMTATTFGIAVPAAYARLVTHAFRLGIIQGTGLNWRPATEPRYQRIVEQLLMEMSDDWLVLAAAADQLNVQFIKEGCEAAAESYELVREVETGLRSVA